MIQLYLPCIFLIMLGWIVFWMSPDNWGDRLTVGITCILTIVLLLGYINGMLPKIRELAWLKHEMHSTGGGTQGFVKIRHSLGYQHSRKPSQEGHFSFFKKNFQKIRSPLKLDVRCINIGATYLKLIWRRINAFFALVDNQGSLQTLLLFTSEELYIVALPKMQRPCLSHPKHFYLWIILLNNM